MCYLLAVALEEEVWIGEPLLSRQWGRLAPSPPTETSSWVGVGSSSVIIVFQANTMAEKIENHPFVSFQSLVF